MFREYVEAGYSVFPVGSNKRPAIKEWKPYQTRLPTEEELLLWEKQYANCGIALVCGEISKVLAVDIDTEDEDVRRSCPKSPVVKSGNPKKETRFFYFPHKMGKMNPPGVDILSNGSYTVLPPSIHPETKKPYFWHSEHQLPSILAQDLPEITMEDIEQIQFACSVFAKENKDGSPMVNYGRNNSLAKVCFAILTNKAYKTDIEIAEDLIQYDIKIHKGREYFWDAGEYYFHKADTPLKRAQLFVRTSRTNMKRKGEIPEDAYVDISSVEFIKPKEIILPKSSGLIDQIAGAINATNHTVQPMLSLGAAITLCGTLASLKFQKFGGKPVPTNLYTMGVARSGSGKDAAKRIISDILFSNELRKQGLMGISNYSSVASFVEHLSTQRARLDLVDEFEEVIVGINKGSNLQVAVKNVITAVYSAGAYFSGHKTSTKGKTGACTYPAVSIYGNIQEKILVSSATASMLDSGFLSRFIYFTGDSEPKFNEDRVDNVKLDLICENLAKAYPHSPLFRADGGQPVDEKEAAYCLPVMDVLVEDDSYKKRHKEYSKELLEMNNELYRSGNEAEATLVSRISQHCEKIAVIHATSCGRHTVTAQDYEYAQKVSIMCFEQSKLYLASTAANGEFEKKRDLVIRHLTKKGKMQHSDLLKASKMHGVDFRKLMSTLKESKVVIFEDKNGPCDEMSKYEVYYSLIKQK